MFADDTVFIVGAGASAEFDLPVGSALMETIKKNSQVRTNQPMSEPVRDIYQTLLGRHQQTGAIQQRLAAMAEIHRSIDLAGSIDEFINRHHNDPMIAEVGKLQIAYAIAKAEQKSYLSLGRNSEQPFVWESLTSTWIRTFAQLLFEGVRNDEAEQIGNNITIICFNYDRCIEHYLSEAIVKTFRGVDLTTAYRIVDRINIIHPYGSLGRLEEFPFGANFTPAMIQTMSDSIVTWSESVMSERRVEIERAMQQATTLIFLGFAFAPQNMDLLTTESIRPRHAANAVQVYATGYGYDDVIDRRLRQKISNLYAFQAGVTSDEFIHVQYDMKCARFIQSHSMALIK